jgi:hypothetical protein
MTFNGVNNLACDHPSNLELLRQSNIKIENKFRIIDQYFCICIILSTSLFKIQNSLNLVNENHSFKIQWSKVLIID